TDEAARLAPGRRVRAVGQLVARVQRTAAGEPSWGPGAAGCQAGHAGGVAGPGGCCPVAVSCTAARDGCWGRGASRTPGPVGGAGPLPGNGNSAGRIAAAAGGNAGAATEHRGFATGGQTDRGVAAHPSVALLPRETADR